MQNVQFRWCTVTEVLPKRLHKPIHYYTLSLFLAGRRKSLTASGKAGRLTCRTSVIVITFPTINLTWSMSPFFNAHSNFCCSGLSPMSTLRQRKTQSNNPIQHQTRNQTRHAPKWRHVFQTWLQVVSKIAYMSIQRKLNGCTARTVEYRLHCNTPPANASVAGSRYALDYCSSSVDHLLAILIH